MAVQKCITLWILSTIVLSLYQANCNPVVTASNDGIHTTLTSIQVQESKSVSRLETYKNVQVFVYRVPLESTFATLTLTSNASHATCDVLPLKFHLRWRAIPVVSIQSKRVISYLSTTIENSVQAVPNVIRSSLENGHESQTNTTVPTTTSTFQTKQSNPYEYLLPSIGDAAEDEEDKETESIHRYAEDEMFETDLKSDSIPVYINVTNPLPGIWIGLAYINSTDDRIQQKGLFTKCTTWIQSSLKTYGLSPSSVGTVVSSKSGSKLTSEKLVTLNAGGAPLDQSLSMSKSPRYYRFYTESSEKSVQVTISKCSTNRILGMDLVSDTTNCPLKVNYRKRGLPSSDHKSAPTLNCSYLPSNCTIVPVSVTSDGFNYLEISTIWQEEGDRNRDRTDYNITFNVQVTYHDSICGGNKPVTLSPLLGTSTTTHNTTTTTATTDHSEHKSSNNNHPIVAPTASTHPQTIVPLFEVIRTTEAEVGTTERPDSGRRRQSGNEKRAQFPSSSSPSSAVVAVDEYETSSEKTLTSPDVIDTVPNSDPVENIPLEPVDNNPANPVDTSSNNAGSSNHDNTGTSFVPGGSNGDNLSNNNNNNDEINPDNEFGAWRAHVPGGGISQAGFIPTGSMGHYSPLIGSRRHRFYDRYVPHHHRSHRAKREVSSVDVSRVEQTCPERKSLVRYNQQGSFNFRYDYSQGTGSGFNSSKVFPDTNLSLKNSNKNSTNLTILDFDIFDLLDSGGTMAIELALEKKSLNTTYHNVTVEACLSYDNPPSDGDFSTSGGLGGHCIKVIQVNSSSSPVAHFNGKDSFVSELLVPFPKSGKWFLTLKSSCYFDRKDIISHLVSTSTTEDSTSVGTISNRPQVIPVPCEYNTTLIAVRVKSSSCSSRCTDHGKCGLVFPSSGEISFGTCICKPGWTGWSCDQIDPKVQVSEEQILMNFLALVLSNLLFLLPIVVCLFRCQFVEATVYTLTMVSSSLYHACDSSSQYATCVLSNNLLQFGDFYSALLAFWVTLISLGNMRDGCKSFLHFTGGIAIAFLVEYDRTSLISFLVPVGTGVTIMILSWMSHCVHRRRCFPSGLLWCCSIFPGVLVTTIGLVVYTLLETRDNYPMTHSIWHGTCALALLFLVPSIRSGRRKHGRKSCCGPATDSDDEDNDDNDTFRTKGSSDTYYELITDEASHLARHLPPGGSSSSSNGNGVQPSTSGYSGVLPSSSSHRNSVNYTDRPIPAVRTSHHRESTSRRE